MSVSAESARRAEDGQSGGTSVQGGRSASKKVTRLPSVTVRFAGDSGDGMQLAGTQFTDTSALFGNDISTLPDLPAEIRAPAGTLAGEQGVTPAGRPALAGPP